MLTAAYCPAVKVLPAKLFKVTPDAPTNPTGAAPNCITEQLNPTGNPVGIVKI